MNSNEIFEYIKTPHTGEELLAHPSFSHTRVSRWSQNDLIVYFRCSDSPSGVLSAGGFIRTRETDKIMRERNLRANLGPSRGDIACAHPCGTIGF
jgi:hypothetical protein